MFGDRKVIENNDYFIVTHKDMILKIPLGFSKCFRASAKINFILIKNCV